MQSSHTPYITPFTPFVLPCMFSVHCSLFNSKLKRKLVEPQNRGSGWRWTGSDPQKNQTPTGKKNRIRPRFKYWKNSYGVSLYLGIQIKSGSRSSRQVGSGSAFNLLKTQIQNPSVRDFSNSGSDQNTCIQIRNPAQYPLMLPWKSFLVPILRLYLGLMWRMRRSKECTPPCLPGPACRVFSSNTNQLCEPTSLPHGLGLRVAGVAVLVFCLFENYIITMKLS